MKLRNLTLVVAVVSAISGTALAAPVLQTCAPMEIKHQGELGLSYTLACSAGDWRLNYRGSIPAGNEPVSAQYQVSVRAVDGTNYVLNRTVSVPAPALLGQMLVREAVELDNGDLALRDCKEFACTLYRPLGSKGQLAKASVTVTPETKRLRDEQLKLSQDMQRATAEAKQAGKQLQDATTKLASIQADRDALAAKLASAEKALEDARTGAGNLVAAQEQAYKTRIAELEKNNSQLTTTLSELRAQFDSIKLKANSKPAFDYIIADLVSQHDTQLSALKQAMPDTNLSGIVHPLVIPKMADVTVVPQSVKASNVKVSASKHHKHRRHKRHVIAGKFTTPAPVKNAVKPSVSGASSAVPVQSLPVSVAPLPAAPPLKK